MFLPLRLLSSLTGTAYADSDPGDEKKLSQNSVLALKYPKNINGLELLRTNISVAQSQNDTNSAEQLRQIIAQIRSVEFKPKKQAPETVIGEPISQKNGEMGTLVPEKADVPEPNETVPDTPDVSEVSVQKEKQTQQIKRELPYEPVTDQTLQMLGALAQEPEKLTNPHELGETLFQSGNLKEASIFYREALRRKDPNDVGTSLDRAWILFQIGNCLRGDDMSAAAKAYQQLLTEYPNSPWSALAKARNDLITWYMKNEPDKLMQKVKEAKSQ